MFSYYSVYEDVTWDKSLLRDWLNSDFYIVAFSKEEQDLISLSRVKADKNHRYPTSQGAETQDNVFVLSIVEAEKYFDSQEARRGKATVYVKNSLDRHSNSCDWWLRTMGVYQNYASYVAGTTGIINRAGESVNTDGIGVRPVIWIELSK